MPLMTWTDKLSVGVRILDEDHKRLIALLNELHDSMKAGHSKESLGRILGELVQYTRVHFAREEKYLVDSGYPAVAAHKKEHDTLTRQVLDVQQKYLSGTTVALSIDVLKFLKDWLIDHIQGRDQKYRQHLNTRGIV
jgi:hemerythrin-like metal-binding protein